MCGFQQAGRQWLQSLFGMSSNPGELSHNPQHGQPAIGLSQIRPGGIPGTYLGKRLLVPVEQWQRWRTLKWWTKSGDGHCQVQQSCRYWMSAAEWPGLSWMIKLIWKAMLCYRKASYMMFSRKSVQLHGRALLDKGLRSPLCCLAVRCQMTGLTSCCRKGTYGPPLLLRGLPQRWLPKRPFVKNGADCRPSMFGWRSSWAGMFLRKFGYSEHCVYTGAMLSFIYSLFGLWRFNFGNESFWFWFLAIHFGSEGFCFDIWEFTSGTAFHLGFWKSMRSMVMLQRGVRRNGV